jgi:probable phosphoglycerate mutase
MQLIVVRHGETEWNAEGRIQGHQDVALNERGERQVAAVARRLASARVDAVYSSDLRRTMQTAEHIAEALGKKIIQDQRLREWKLGVLETLIPNEAAEKEPEAYRIYMERDPELVVPGGESIRQRHERAIACVREIDQKDPGERVVVVTHGGIVDDLYRSAMGIALDADQDWPLYNCGINTLRIKGGELKVEKWGDVEHLKEIGSMADWSVEDEDKE